MYIYIERGREREEKSIEKEETRGLKLCHAVSRADTRMVSGKQNSQRAPIHVSRARNILVNIPYILHNIDIMVHGKNKYRRLSVY